MKKIKQTLGSIVIRYPKTIVTVTLLLGIIAVALLPKLRTDPNPYLLGEDHASRINLRKLRSDFTGAGNKMIILLSTKETVFTPQTLTRIKELTTRLETIDLLSETVIAEMKAFAQTLDDTAQKQLVALIENGLDEFALDTLYDIQTSLKERGKWTPAIKHMFEKISTCIMPVSKITSLSNTDNIIGNPGGLSVNPIYDEIPESPAVLERLQQDVLDNPLLHHTLVSPDAKHTAIIIELAIKETQSKEQFALYNKVNQILAHDLPGNERHYVAGLPVITAALSYTIKEDTKRFFPIVLLLVILCLYFTFRSASGVAIPILVVLISLAITLAIKVLFDIPLNIITTSIPVFVLSIGVADSIHMISEYRDNILSGMTPKAAVRETINMLTFPVTMTSLTTAGAFLSLAITQIVQMRYFGVFIAIGTLLALIISLLFIPAFLYLIPQQQTAAKHRKTPRMDRFIATGLTLITQWTVRYSKPVLIMAAIVTTVAIFGATQVRVDNNTVKYFPPTAELAVSSHAINEHMGGAMNLNIVISDADNTPGALKDPQTLNHIAALEAFIEKQPVVGKIASLTKLIERINYALHDNDPQYNRIPKAAKPIENSKTGTANESNVSGKALISQYLLLYENSGGDTLSDVTDIEYTKTNIRVMIRTNSSYAASHLVDDIKHYTDAFLPKHLKVEFSGWASILIGSTHEIVAGQITSLAISLILIFVMLMSTFRAVKKGAIAVVPLLATITVNFGIMGFFNVPLDIGSAVVSSIVIGIGIDYGIHYLSRFYKNINNGAPIEEAIADTVIHSGKAITLNAAVVSLGFAALMFSTLRPVFTMGWMIIVTMLISAICTTVLLPALLTATWSRSISSPFTLRPKKDKLSRLSNT